MDKLATLILAAGSSSRLGQPKQLLEYQGSTLIGRICRTALSVTPSVHVPLGSQANQIEEALKGYPVQTHLFNEWKQGMGSTIAFGVRKIIESAPDTDKIMILVCDQIKTSTLLLNQLIQKHLIEKNDITACSYSETIGVPAIFNQTTFINLQKLSGEKGAKSLIKSLQYQVGSTDFPEGIIDIDSIDDLRHLQP